MSKKKKKQARREKAGSREAAKPTSAPPRRTRKLLLVAAAAVVLIAVSAGLILFLRLPRWRSGLPPELAPGSAAGYNVLLITLDTTRADHIGCYGARRAETPAIDGLAREGILFADAVCTAPSTLPSHASMFTGLYPPNHGARLNGDFVLGPEQVTLAEILQSAGYETAAFASSFVVNSRFGLNQGFDIYDETIGVDRSGSTVAELNQRPAGDVTRAAIQWLERRSPDRPFFAWVHYFDPHLPYSPPPAFAARYRGRLYDGEIAYMDSEIAKLLAALDGRGLRNKTLVIAVADHGEGLGDHGESTHDRLIYESVMRIPLILACPGLFSGPYRVEDAVVATIDIFPTVLELLGLRTARSVDGVSLLAARDRRDRAIYMEGLTTYVQNGWAPLFGLRRHADKYILAPRPEYYDLRKDPGEMDNGYSKARGSALAARDQLVTDLAAMLERWPPPAKVAASALAIDAETRHRLASLGYLAGAARSETDQPLPDPKDMMPIIGEIDRANAFFRAGRLDEALSTIHDAASVAPEDPWVLFTEGKILLFMKRDKEAEAVLRRSIVFRALPDACILLAQLLIGQGRYAEAVPIIDRGEQIDPLSGGLWIARGDMAAFQGEYDAAIAAYRRAEEIDPVRVGDAARERIRQTEAKRATSGSAGTR
jgi:choline-sulfatase